MVVKVFNLFSDIKRFKTNKLKFEMTTLKTQLLLKWEMVLFGHALAES